MGSLERRTGALEAYIERRAEERVRQELEAALEKLEDGLSREEFMKVVRIVAGVEDGA